jgi:hypothetical protein
VVLRVGEVINMETLRGILDSVNGRIIQGWALVVIGLLGYCTFSWFPLPEQVTGVVFGLGMGVLTASLAAPNDGK